MHRPLLTALLLAATTFASAQIYKWTDEHGQIHYSDKPQQSKNETTLHVVSRNGIVSGSAGQKSIAQQDTEFKTRQKNQAASAAKAEEAAAKDKEKATYCSNLKTHIAALKSGAPLAKFDENGNRSMVSNDEKEAQMADAQQQLDKDCN